MKYTWINDLKAEVTIKKLLTVKGVSHRILSRVKRGEGEVWLEGKKSNLTQKVAIAEHVTLGLIPENNPAILPAVGALKILFEDQNWLVVDKPAGITSVPGPSNRKSTLVNRIKGYLMAQGAQDLVPHIITRLDRDTSGIVLVAKNRLAQGLIGKQTEKQQLQKRYLAVISGRLPQQHGLIEACIGRQDKQIKREVTAAGQFAKTEYWVLDESSGTTLVEVKLHTGRTHQIRVHFSAIGCPLLGDELYGGDLNKGITRQALHAFKLSYLDPFTLQKNACTAALPDDMQALCSHLGLDILTSQRE
ncbi:RluA family pseudouridine synthase [Liquorilactobacillus satsumensis]|uniref:Pseudouridine synthase n=1 Tax=Liquorilactobacillus satsumensis DSM 16230 = JCM 12392 TaxID=1423801 RepID=A0A0R1UZY5_9LACO|nr:RluA family pseudouridine synthase [Liquorilactobacillus satsumensis]KRL96922.1 ribosomal large subunit pseudouridine synthase D [Liquorilactobacillus satsumensis DSM 16230 = JCM 12392]MCC7667811.1 RluA family pseudouridine synthase [Liquorilactobacillus satsumensis]MCP9312434.1 RluA family pseudouridine synthase [Liquorilactobacillus satsumensis]MCP9358557.1 RluA family pseudouridine synthase [Liquorilactobacillus satsumensis]MCP9359723.1 RluA family pseudouridine synthase [Liquorilactobac